MIKQSTKKRHELSGDKIRALYGHSTPEKIVLEKQAPPEVLYHGTAKRFLDNIKQDGLLPMGRQYVHLSVDVETAKQVGRRRDPKPVILVIKSKQAYEDGINFYHGNENIWLSDSIESKYIEISTQHAGEDA
jgi:putative RNA 2'-phosphotransferase